jgi:YrbI family 3-deoxy-D-manno-octulosonate 8-phosphate phosphatase
MSPSRRRAQEVSSAAARRLLRSVELVVFDFDGVFTDNRVLVDEEGREAVFCTRADGIGVEALRRAGVESMVLSTEPNPVVAHRAAKLKMACVHGASDKWATLAEILRVRNVKAARVAYVGNDINDRGCLEHAGVPICVADAHPDVLPLARLVTERRGGEGAVREICDAIVRARGSRSRARRARGSRGRVSGA